jgi:hypothetical protein
MHTIFMIRRRRRTGKLLSDRPNRFWFVCGFLDNLFLDFTTDNHWRSHIWSKEQKLLGLFGKPYTDDNHNLHGDVLKFWFQFRPGITCIFFPILKMPTTKMYLVCLKQIISSSNAEMWSSEQMQCKQLETRNYRGHNIEKYLDANANLENKIKITL